MDVRNFKTILHECQNIIDDPFNRIRRQKKKDPDTRYFGYNCIFAPEEIIHAAGFVPIRTFADYRGNRFSEKYFHSRTCDFARNLLETFLDGQFDFLEGCVFTHCCDVLHALFETIKKTGKGICYINMPYNDNNKIARKFVRGELEKFKSYLEKTYHLKIKNRALRRSVSIYKKNHRLLQELSCFLKEGYIEGNEYFVLQKAGYFIRKEEHNELLSAVIKDLGQVDGKTVITAKEKGKKVLVSGFVNGEIELLEYIENLGARIVADDLCGFSRCIMPGDKHCFLKGSGQEIGYNCLSKSCPLKIGSENHYDVIKNKYKESGAKGIIFLIYPFCDPQGVEYAWLKHRLDEDGIKTLKIEPPVIFQGSAQARVDTRIEAFLEMIREDEC